ncbi:hypothetical protein QTP88_011389 [Uroleucon formosanum]
MEGRRMKPDRVGAELMVNRLRTLRVNDVAQKYNRGVVDEYNNKRHKDFSIHGGCDEWCRKTIGPFVYTSGTMAQISAAFRRTDPSSSLYAVSPPSPPAVCKNNKKQLSAAHNR